MKIHLSIFLKTSGILIMLFLCTSCCLNQEKKNFNSNFEFSQSEIIGAKPWTSENFKNNPDDFHFAILGDRGGGASPLGTYERAIFLCPG